MKDYLLLGFLLCSTFQLPAQDFSEFFGSLADGTTITTSNTNFTYVRVGSGGGSIEAESPNCFGDGTGSAMQIGGTISSSLNGVGVLDDTFTASSFSVMTFKVRSSDMSAGDLVITMGDGSSYSGNSGFSSAELMWAIQSDAGNLEYRSSGWKNVGETLSDNTDYFFEVVSNRTGATVNYTSNGGGSVATGTMDLFMNESLVGDDLPMQSSQDARAFRIYQINGGAVYCVDDIKVWLNTADVNAALPVELVKFNARSQASEILLDWQTASETNHRTFIIERKSDLSTFQEIGSLAGEGNSALGASYQFIDRMPFSGNNYYRLGQEDINGQITYSEIVKADLLKEKPSFQLKSTLVSNILEMKIDIQNETGGTLLISNLSGQLVSKKELAGGQIDYKINTSEWGSGMYFITLTIQNQILTEKIIIK